MNWSEAIPTTLWYKPFGFLKQEWLTKGFLHIFPDATRIAEAFRVTAFDDVRAVIIGQDPYHTKGHANGLAFSVGQKVSPLPPSLQNIFRELVDDTGLPYPSSGDLTPWAKQGVLLLNTSLSVEEGKPGSHANIGWQEVTTAAIESLSRHRTNIVFLLWGKHAQQFEPKISDSHHIIKSSHPSPFSVHKGFLGSKPFTRTNNFLISKNLPAIDWRLP